MVKRNEMILSVDIKEFCPLFRVSIIGSVILSGVYLCTYFSYFLLLTQAVYSPTNVSISCEIISNPILPQRNISWEIHSMSFGLYSKLGHGAYSVLGAAIARSHLILNRTVFHQGLNYVLVLKILGE